MSGSGGSDSYPISRRDLAKGVGALTLGGVALTAEEIREFLSGGDDESEPSTDRRSATETVNDVQKPYDRDVELSDEDLQYAIDNTAGTDQELSNIKNIDGNLYDFGYDPNSDEFYVEIEAEDEETRVGISEEAYWNAVDN